MTARRRSSAGRRQPKQRDDSARPEDPRALALRVMARIEDDGAYANLVLARTLDRSSLERRDRALVTALVDGTTRMRRACDHLVDRFLQRDIEPSVRRVLRMGAYQLVFMGVPAHAAVSATVAVAPRRAGGLVNAVLRRVSQAPLDPTDRAVWPDEATRLSYPTWLVDRLGVDLGGDVAAAALAAMNEPASAVVREDGYVQDVASQEVVAVVDPGPGTSIIDVCAAPGGKATAMAGAGATVIALDHTPNRAGLIVSNASTTATADRVRVGVADGRYLPFRAASRATVLVDAPCSGLGSLRRRADARWRVDARMITELATLQRALLTEAARVVRPRGRLVYSVCTLTRAETIEIDAWFASAFPDFDARPLPQPWQPLGRGGQLLPTLDGRDGMSVFDYVRRGD